MAITFRPTTTVTDEEIEALSRANPLHGFERTAQGELVVMPPTGTDAGEREGKLFFQLALWNEHRKLGRAYPATTGFNLPNTALRAPDASWISNERYDALSPAQHAGFAHVCPDAAFDLLSPSDDPADIRGKMPEYIDSGCRLAVYIDPRRRLVDVYRPNCETETFPDPATLTFEAELPGFTLDLAPIFESAKNVAQSRNFRKTATSRFHVCCGRTASSL